MIRPYQTQDLEPLIEVWFQASLIAHPFLDEAFLTYEKQAIREKYMPLAETWVYEQAGLVVGFIALIDHEVGAIFVNPNHQGQGIGQALMNHAVQARDYLELDVFKDNTIGRKFYDRYGFQFVHEHTHPETGFSLLRLRFAKQSA